MQAGCFSKQIKRRQKHTGSYGQYHSCWEISHYNKVSKDEIDEMAA